MKTIFQKNIRAAQSVLDCSGKARRRRSFRADDDSLASENNRAGESGVALRFPPQSKTSRTFRAAGFFTHHASLVTLLCFFILHSAFCLRVAAQSYSIDWYKMSGGGGTSSNGTLSVSGTIGQADANNTVSGGNYAVTGGFWSLYAVQTPGAPTLKITQAGGQAIISWDPSVIGYTLQTNANLATGSWGNYVGTVANNTATNSPPKGTVFFRLKK
jgi:hypothetical protein